MPSGSPTREQADLAEVLEMVLDKGIVINADVAITVGETELLGIELRAAIASFETAAKYGLAFPSGTDMRRVEQASGRQSLEGEGVEPVDLGIEASSGGSAAEDEDEDEDDGSDGSSSAAPGRRPTPTVMAGAVGDEVDEVDEANEEAGADEPESESDADDGDSAGDDTDDAEADADDAGSENEDADGGDA